ncbi:MAG: hypothetical protein K5662_03345 [Lachnospiraceae bacterium]|nr:hypothetical protein [Lachnospiraceae bacterium]
MIRFARRIYCSESIKGIRRIRIKWQLMTGRGDLGLYIVAVNNNTGHLEYFHNAMFKQRAIRRGNYLICGFAGSKNECEDIILNITEDTLDATGSFDLCEYVSR